MNIFEYLGLPSDHRASDKVFMAVKHWDEVNKKADQGILHAKVSFPISAQCKKDGVFSATLVIDGVAAIFNRTGKRMTNVAHLELRYSVLPNGIYLGELCNEHCSLEVLSGMVNPNRVNPLDEYHSCMNFSSEVFFFDFITIADFKDGYTDVNFLARFKSLVYRLEVDHSFQWLAITTICNQVALDEYFQVAIDNGQEGAVFKQDVEWLAGAKDWHQMKKVRQCSYDLECIGYEEGTGKYAGKVANLLFRWKGGKKIKAMLGKGWTHELAEEMFNNIKLTENWGSSTAYNSNLSPYGKVFRVYALQESSKGVLRLPKVAEFRHDKDVADF